MNTTHFILAVAAVAFAACTHMENPIEEIIPEEPTEIKVPVSLSYSTVDVVESKAVQDLNQGTFASGEGITVRTCSAEELKLLNSEEELAIIRHLASLTEEIITAAKAYDPARITRFVTTLATLFHKFYNARRVAVEDESLMMARLNLCLAVKTTIKSILEMFKITAPEKM